MGKGFEVFYRTVSYGHDRGRLFQSVQKGGAVLDWMVLFSQILTTLERFIEEHDDIHTINVSLGYNWRSNFGNQS